MPRKVVYGSPIVRFMAKVKINQETGCWEWTGAHNAHGYALFGLTDGGNSRCVLAHRWIQEYNHGPIPEGMTIDHLCRNKECVNSDHHELVTNAENARRAKVARNITHCPHGHAFDPDNFYLNSRNGSKQCKECNRIRNRKKYHELKHQM
jgi:hypothetical protein